jgi:hypothetical protein
MFLAVDTDPASLQEEADMAVRGQVRPLMVSFNHESYAALLEWVDGVRERASYAAMLAQRARAHLSAALKERVKHAGEFAQIYASPDKFIKIDLSIHAPTVLLPCLASGLGDESNTSLFALTLGHLSLSSMREDGRQRFAARLESTNMAACSSNENHRSQEHALFTKPISLSLALDRATESRPATCVQVNVGDTDMRITKVHVLHAFAVQDTLAAMLAMSAEEKAAKKARARKKLQKQQIEQRNFGVERRSLKLRLAKMDILNRPGDTSDGSAESEGKKRGSLLRKGEKKLDLKVKVESLSLKLEEAVDKTPEGSQIWANTCTPQMSIQLQVLGAAVHSHSWDSGERELQASVESVIVRHMTPAQEGDADGAQFFDIVAPQLYNKGMRRLVGLATTFEKTFREVDVDGNGSFNLDEVRNLTQKLKIPVQDSQLSQLLATLDKDSNGHLEIAEFMQLAALVSCETPGNLKGSNFVMPLPSQMPREDKTFLTCNVISTRVQPEDEMTEDEEMVVETRVAVSRLEVQVASIPVRNVVDWVNLCTKAAVHDTEPGREQEEEIIAGSQAPAQNVGIQGLRASFECDVEDIFVLPKVSMRVSVEMEEIEIVVHDFIVGDSALFFRAGPLRLGLSSDKPTCWDADGCYESEMNLELENLRILYGRSVLSMDWDLETILKIASMAFKTTASMPQDLSGSTKIQKLTVADSSVVVKVALRHLLFLHALKGVYQDLHLGNRGLLKLAQANPQASLQLSEEKSSLYRRSSSTRRVLREESSFLQNKGEAVVAPRCRRNLRVLSREFVCPRVTLELIDDLPELSEQDNLDVRTVRLLQLQISDVHINETVSLP